MLKEGHICLVILSIIWESYMFVQFVQPKFVAIEMIERMNKKICATRQEQWDMQSECVLLAVPCNHSTEYGFVSGNAHLWFACNFN